MLNSIDDGKFEAFRVAHAIFVEGSLRVEYFCQLLPFPEAIVLRKSRHVIHPPFHPSTQHASSLSRVI